jgi:hypothetical protein
MFSKKKRRERSTRMAASIEDSTTAKPATFS